MSKPWAAVIGIGNELRRDDGIGPAVAAEIQRRQIPGVRVVISQGEPTGLLDAWAGVRLAVVIDAVVGEPATPGRWHRITTDRLSPLTGTAGTHGLGVPEAMELGRVLDRMPQQLIVYAIEVADVSIGVELSAALAASVPVLVDAVLGELEHTDIG
jgi:hydrogenase maturation protease